MGQAKRRGTFEERKTAAEDKAEKARIEREAEKAESARRLREFEAAHPEEAKKRHNYATLCAATLGLIAGSIGPHTRG